MIEKAFEMIRLFLEDSYDVLDFSYDLPQLLIEGYDEMYAENIAVTEVLNDNMPEICADYEMGEFPDKFKTRVQAEYTKALSLYQAS